MTTVEQALETILSQVQVLGSERIDILGSRGRVLAEDIVSGLDVPPHDNSSMDGYAVRHTDIAAAVADQPVHMVDQFAESDRRRRPAERSSM